MAFNLLVRLIYIFTFINISVSEESKGVKPGERQIADILTKLSMHSFQY